MSAEGGGAEPRGALVGEAQPLTAVDTVRPGPGEVVEVVEGEVLVFAVDHTDRRTSLATVGAGEVVVGCDGGEASLALLVTGLPGTRVRVATLDDQSGTDRLERWVEVLGAAVSRGRWPSALVPVASAAQLVAPGERIGAARDGAAITWVRIVGGEAALCDHAEAVLRAGETAFPLPRGSWLTAGLHSRVVPAAAPSGAAQWRHALALWGRLAVTVVEERRRADDMKVAQRRQERDERSGAAVQQAVDLLTASVGAPPRPPVLSDEHLSAHVAAAVATARAAGLTISEDALVRVAEEVESGRDPVLAVAAACGARARPVTLEPGWTSREGAPLLVEVGASHSHGSEPRALIWHRGWTLNDGNGNVEPLDAARAEQVSRSALELLPVLPSRPTTLRELARLSVRGINSEWRVVALLTVLIAGMSFLTPFLFGQLAVLFKQAAPASAFLALFVALMLVVVAGAAWQSLRSLALLRARSRTVDVGFGAMWERVMRLPATWHGQRTLGNRLSQASSVNAASTAFPDETLTRVLDTATVVGSLLAIATTGAPLFLTLATLFALQAAVVTWFLSRSVSRATARIATSAEATGRLIEILRAVNRLRVSGAESRAFLRWAELQAQFARADLALRRITMLQGVVLACWPLLAVLVIVAVTGAIDGTYQQFITAQTAAAAATIAISAMALSGNAAVFARQSLRKAQPALDAVPEGGGEGEQPGQLSGGIEVRDIVFRYAPDLPPVLDHVSLRVEPGEQVAIVGPSGCGKTTLMRIILGLEEAASGVMLIDGRDLAGLDRIAVRRQVGSVLQSAVLLPCTIRENVTMGRPLTNEQVWAALDAAWVGQDVRALALGLDTPVTDGGGTLSGGQRQRVLIARALAGQPRILVLDEATSALDNVTQAAIVESLNALHVTRIVVAHRLSTIRHADRIVVLDAGRVIDEGTYDDLMSRPGPFRELAARQEA